VPNMAGSAYELTFPRWLAQSEILAYPFRPNPALPVWDMKFWYGDRNTSRTVTNDIAATQLNNHVDDLPFTLPQLPGDTLLFTSRGSTRLAIQKRNAATGLFEYIETYDTPTTLRPTTLTSFEPFVINGNKTYGAYQVYEGGGIPGTTRGEIWLKGILGETLQTKISTLDGVTVDPEYVIGRSKVWIYYYGKPVGQQYFDLHRCETPLTLLLTSVREQPAADNIRIAPNPAQNLVTVQDVEGASILTLTNVLGQVVLTRNIDVSAVTLDVSSLPSGVYALKAQTQNRIHIQTLQVLR
jgi:hypothetical protein